MANIKSSITRSENMCLGLSGNNMKGFLGTKGDGKYAEGGEHGEWRFFVPVIQRDYQWTAEMAIGLFETIVKDFDAKHSSCWLNAIYILNDSCVEPSRKQVFDGQQRLTTLSLIICGLLLVEMKQGTTVQLDESTKQHLQSFLVRNNSVVLDWGANDGERATFRSVAQFTAEEDIMGKIPDGVHSCTCTLNDIWDAPKSNLELNTNTTTNLASIVERIMYHVGVREAFVKEFSVFLMNNVQLLVVETCERPVALRMFKMSNAYPSQPFTPFELLRMYTLSAIPLQRERGAINEWLMQDFDTLKMILAKHPQNPGKLMRRAVAFIQRLDNDRHVVVNESPEEYFMASVDEIVTKAVGAAQATKPLREKVRQVQYYVEAILELEMYNNTPQPSPLMVRKARMLAAKETIFGPWWDVIVVAWAKLNEKDVEDKQRRRLEMLEMIERFVIFKNLRKQKEERWRVHLDVSLCVDKLASATSFDAFMNELRRCCDLSAEQRKEFLLKVAVPKVYGCLWSPVVKYILVAADAQVGKSRAISTKDYKNLEIEHIRATKNQTDGNSQAIDPPLSNEFQHSLANLVLLPKQINKGLSARTFEEKREYLCRKVKAELQLAQGPGTMAAFEIFFKRCIPQPVLLEECRADQAQWTRKLGKLLYCSTIYRVVKEFDLFQGLISEEKLASLLRDWSEWNDKTPSWNDRSHSPTLTLGWPKSIEGFTYTVQPTNQQKLRIEITEDVKDIWNDGSVSAARLLRAWPQDAGVARHVRRWLLAAAAGDEAAWRRTTKYLEYVVHTPQSIACRSGGAAKRIESRKRGDETQPDGANERFAKNMAFHKDDEALGGFRAYLTSQNLATNTIRTYVSRIRVVLEELSGTGEYSDDQALKICHGKGYGRSVWERWKTYQKEITKASVQNLSVNDNDSTRSNERRRCRLDSPENDRPGSRRQCITSPSSSSSSALGN